MRANISSFTSGLQSAQGQLGSFVAGVQSKLGGMSLMFMGGLGLKSFLDRAIEGMTKLGKSAEALGMTTSMLAGLQHGAELLGISAETLDSRLMRMTRGLGQAQEGGGKFGKALDQLNLDVSELSKLSADQVILRISNALAGVKNIAQQTHLAEQLLGRGGGELLPLLGQGAAGIEKMRDEVARLGPVNEASVAAVRAVTAAWRQFDTAVTGIGRSLAVALAPILTVTGQRMAAIAREIAVFAVDNRDLWQAISGTVAAAMKALGDAVKTILPSAGGEWNTWRDALVKAFITAEYYVTNWREGLTLALSFAKLGFETVKASVSDLFERILPARMPALSNVLRALAEVFKAAFVNPIVTATQKLLEFISILSKAGNWGWKDVLSIPYNLGARLGAAAANALGLGSGNAGDVAAASTKAQMDALTKALAELRGAVGDVVGDMKARPLTKAEEELWNEIQAIMAAGADDIDAFVAKRIAELKALTAKDKEKPPGAIEGVDYKKPAAMELGSAAAFSVLYAQQSAQEKALDLARVQIDHLAAIRNKIENADPFPGALLKEADL